MRKRVFLLCGGLAMAAALLSPAASAAATQTCKGTAEKPGVLVGRYAGDVRVEGACAVSAGPAEVRGTLTLRPGSVLAADSGMNGSRLTVDGSIRMQRGAVMVLGCDPQSSPCSDDPNPSNPTLSSAPRVGGSIIAQGALGVIVHNTTVGRNFVEVGGGGGFNCDPQGPFKKFPSPVFSAFEDSKLGGSLLIRDLHSCWLGVARVGIGGSARFIDNHLADPDAIEILSNHVGDDLACFGNSMVWDSTETSSTGALYPRAPAPNSVEGKRLGQCVLANPPTDSSPPGPGPF